MKYLAIRPTPALIRPRPPVSLRPGPALPHPLLCRPGARDIATLKDVLIYGYHLPPPGAPQPRVIVDLGCNVGYTLAHFATVYPHARIIGLELEPANYELARENVAWCTNRVEVIHAAIWSEDGTVEFTGDTEDSYHVTRPGSGKGASPAVPSIRSLSMPSLIEEYGLDRIDYLKMDVEGAETELLLRSDPAWLSRVGAIKVEIHEGNFRDIAQVLTDRGFRCEKDASHWSCVVATRDAS